MGSWHLFLIMPFIRFFKMQICVYQVALGLILGARWNGVLAERIIERRGTTARVTELSNIFFFLNLHVYDCFERK